MYHVIVFKTGIPSVRKRSGMDGKPVSGSAEPQNQVRNVTSTDRQKVTPISINRFSGAKPGLRKSPEFGHPKGQVRQNSYLLFSASKANGAVYLEFEITHESLWQSVPPEGGGYSCSPPKCRLLLPRSTSFRRAEAKRRQSVPTTAANVGFRT